MQPLVLCQSASQAIRRSINHTDIPPSLMPKGTKEPLSHSPPTTRRLIHAPHMHAKHTQHTHTAQQTSQSEVKYDIHPRIQAMQAPAHQSSRRLLFLFLVCHSAYVCEGGASKTAHIAPSERPHENTTLASHLQTDRHHRKEENGKSPRGFGGSSAIRQTTYIHTSHTTDRQT